VGAGGCLDSGDGYIQSHGLFTAHTCIVMSLPGHDSPEQQHLIATVCCSTW
jgi:hypothetical protein